MLQHPRSCVAIDLAVPLSAQSLCAQGVALAAAGRRADAHTLFKRAVAEDAQNQAAPPPPYCWPYPSPYRTPPLLRPPPPPPCKPVARLCPNPPGLTARRAPPPLLRTNRTRRVLHPVLIGHAASPPRTKWTRRFPHPVLIGHTASLTARRGQAALYNCGNALRAAGRFDEAAAQLRAALVTASAPPPPLPRLASLPPAHKDFVSSPISVVASAAPLPRRSTARGPRGSRTGAPPPPPYCCPYPPPPSCCPYPCPYCTLLQPAA